MKEETKKAEAPTIQEPKIAEASKKDAPAPVKSAADEVQIAEKAADKTGASPMLPPLSEALKEEKQVASVAAPDASVAKATVPEPSKKTVVKADAPAEVPKKTKAAAPAIEATGDSQLEADKMVREAQRQLASGDKSFAKVSAEKAVSLDSTNIEARALLAEIDSGKSSKVISQSLPALPAPAAPSDQAIAAAAAPVAFAAPAVTSGEPAVAKTKTAVQADEPAPRPEG